jgi:PAS domain S-box-containing protein
LGVQHSHPDSFALGEDFGHNAGMRSSIRGSRSSSSRELKEMIAVMDAEQVSADLSAAVVAVQRQFIAEPDPQQSFAQALQLMIDSSHSEFGCIGEVLRKKHGECSHKLIATSGVATVEPHGAFSERQALEGTELHEFDKLFGAVIRTGKLVISNSPASAPSSRSTPAELPPFESLLGLPLFGSSGELVGLAGLANRRGGFDHASVAFLQPLCDALGVMIEAKERDRRRGEAEAALRASEARLRVFADHVTVGLLLHDSVGRILDVNRQACENLGYTRAELVGMTPMDFDTAVTSADVNEYLARLAAGETIRFDSWNRRKDGSEFPVEVRVRPLWIDGKLHALSLVGDITERKLAESALLEAQQRLALVLKGADVGAWDWDLTTNQVIFSSEWKGQLGYSDEEILNRYEEWESRVHPDDLAGALERVQHAIEQSPTDYKSEFRMRHKDGSWRWILALGSVIAAADGKPARMLGVHIDITDRKRAEEALQVSESRYRSFVDHATDALFLQDHTGRVVDVNQQACANLGYERDEMIGMMPFEFDPDFTPESTADVLMRLDTGETVTFDSHHQRKDGSAFPVEVRLRPFWSNGQRYHIGLVRDITERKRTEQALRESEARLRTLLENLDRVAVQAYEPDGTITFWNRASELFYGYSAAEAVGQDLVQLLYAEPTREQERRIMSEALRTGQPPAAEEVELVRRDGSKITVLTSRIVHPRAGKQQEFFCFDVDISDRKRAEEELGLRQAELLHASRLSTVGQMVAEISHEVAQPLNAIGNFAAASERILESDGGGQMSTLSEYVRAILDQNQRCITILGRLRDFSRRAPTSQANCDISQLLHDSVDLMSLELRRSHVKVGFELADKLPPVLGDRIQLQQVLVNLLTNARDALQDQQEQRRTITIRGFAEPEAVVLEVEDAGSGFSGDALGHLFEPFFTTKRHGMGIGLSICQSILKEHGGRIEAFTNRQGGATFRVRLPLSRKKGHV